MPCEITDGAIVCTTKERDEFPRDGYVCVGFGMAALLRDGEVFIDGEERMDDGRPLTGAECERIAAADPDHVWTIEKRGPMSGAIWTREGREIGRWMQTTDLGGFA